MLRAKKSEVLHTDEWTGRVRAGAAQLAMHSSSLHLDTEYCLVSQLSIFVLRLQ
jgi:hypothetical protein